MQFGEKRDCRLPAPASDKHRMHSGDGGVDVILKVSNCVAKVALEVEKDESQSSNCTEACAPRYGNHFSRWLVTFPVLN